MLLLSLVFEIFDLAFFAVEPVTQLPLNLDHYITTVYGLIHSVTHVFPFLTIAIPFILLAFTAELGLFSYTVILRIVKLIRGAG